MKVASILLGILFLTGTFTLDAHANAYRGKQAPGPMLHAPGDNADLSGKKEIEFRWSPEGDRSGFEYYDFRLYKGNQTYEPGLILKKQVPAGETHTFVGASTFENGQTYSWSVRQEGGSKKGRSSYAVFKAHKTS